MRTRINSRRATASGSRAGRGSNRRGGLKALITLMALVGALSIVSVALSATKTVCPPGSTNGAYCATVTIIGTDKQAVAAAEQAAQAIVNAFSPTTITQTLTHGSFTIVITQTAPGTYTITITNKKGELIGTGTAVITHKASDIATAAASKALKVTLTKAGKKYLQANPTATLTVTSTFKAKHGKKKSAKLTIKT